MGWRSASGDSGFDVDDIRSIGKGLSQVISDLIQTGSSAELVRVRSRVPESLPMRLRVRGLGAFWYAKRVLTPFIRKQNGRT